MRKAKRKKKKKKRKKERTDLLAAKNRERRETKRKKIGEERKKKKKRKEESDQWEREGKSDLTRLVGPSNVYLFTKMPWKLSFHNLKTPKMCFQFC